MAPHKISGSSSETALVTGNGGTWLVTKDAHIAVSNKIALNEVADTVGNTIKVAGELTSNYRSLQSEGTNTTIEILAKGEINGSVLCFGIGATVENRGNIEGFNGSSAIAGYEFGLTVRNYGEIIGNSGSGIVLLGAGGDITNEKGGVISGKEGVRLEPYLGQAMAHVTNHGTIEGYEYGIRGARAVDKIQNDGKIIGDVQLQDSDDIFDNRGGKVVGDIMGGAGDDTLITDDPKLRLVELANQGLDQVKSTVSYHLQEGANVEAVQLIGKKDINAQGTSIGNLMKGNAGDNTLVALGSNDWLDGGKGKDILRGGEGLDRFVFATGYGKDTADFEPGIDDIDVSSWKAMDDFADIQRHASAHGHDLWIKAGNDILVLLDTKRGELDAADFMF